MNRRVKVVLLVAGLAVAATATAVVLVLPSLALTRVLARSFPQNSCDMGFRNLIIGCNFQASRTTRTAPSSATGTTPSDSDATSERVSIEERSWDVTDHCPLGPFAKRLLCASVAEPASDDLQVELSEATGLPLPTGRVLTTEENSPFIKSVHVEAPRDLASVLGFYRVELKKRGWTENDGAVVEPDRAVVAFTTPDGPALLRLIHQDNRTIADLSLRKVGVDKGGAVEKAEFLPSPGQVKLMLGNTTDEEAVITINEQTITLAPRAADHLTADPRIGRKSPDSPEIDLPPGKYKVTLKVASSAAQNREFEVAADETWGLLVGPAGVPLPLHLY